MIGILAKVGGALAALFLLQRYTRVSATFGEISTVQEANGCINCYRITYGDPNGTAETKYERVDASLCQAEGLAVGCPGAPSYTSDETSSGGWLDPVSWFDADKWSERLDARANELEQAFTDLGWVEG